MTFDVSVFDPHTETKVFIIKSTTDDDMIVESNLPDEVCQDDREGNKKDVKDKSKVYEAQTQRNLRSRVKRVDAAATTGSRVLKTTDLSQRNLRSRVKMVDAAPITGFPVLKSTDLTKRRKTVQKVIPKSRVLNFTRFAEPRIVRLYRFFIVSLYNFLSKAYIY
ncbi:hypothetical protein Hanom_Chr16g01427891 [Helianthus anomalus]